MNHIRLLCHFTKAILRPDHLLLLNPVVTIGLLVGGQGNFLLFLFLFCNPKKLIFFLLTLLLNLRIQVLLNQYIEFVICQTRKILILLKISNRSRLHFWRLLLGLLEALRGVFVLELERNLCAFLFIFFVHILKDNFYKSDVDLKKDP